MVEVLFPITAEIWVHYVRMKGARWNTYDQLTKTAVCGRDHCQEFSLVVHPGIRPTKNITRRAEDPTPNHRTGG